MEAEDKLCFSVETYFATVLAYEDREHETDCFGYLLWAQWPGKPGHPVEFEAANVTLDLIKGARKPSCSSAAAIRLTAPMFVHAKEAREELCLIEAPWDPRLLNHTCHLFARKFMPSSVSVVEAMYSDCKNQLNILPCGKGHRVHLMVNHSMLFSMTGNQSGLISSDRLMSNKTKEIYSDNLIWTKTK
eukprot:jgi/Botrbrau1/16100/Bobra.7_2s0066.1